MTRLYILTKPQHRIPRPTPPANIYRTNGEYEEASTLFQRAYIIRKSALGPDHSDTLAAESLYSACMAHTASEV